MGNWDDESTLSSEVFAETTQDNRTHRYAKGDNDNGIHFKSKINNMHEFVFTR